jgi:hypothetical protein
MAWEWVPQQARPSQQELLELERRQVQPLEAQPLRVRSQWLQPLQARRLPMPRERARQSQP